MTVLLRPLARLGLVLLAAIPLSAQVTETPYTVEPGRIRVEMDGLKLSHGRADAAGNTYDAIGVAQTVVSVGLTRSLDAQVGASLFLHESFDFGGRRDSRSGIGDVSLRMKWTFWRDEQRSAAAIVPFVKLPTNSGGVGNDAVEGGFILPVEMHLGAGVRAGAMLRWDVARNDADNGYDARWLVSSFLERHLTETISFYGEAALEAASTGFSNWAGNLGIGTVWHLTTSLEVDVELLRGVGNRATDWTYVARLNWEW
jgi:hypothetical protein